MSGFCGFVGLEGGGPASVRAMLDTIAHRGPDAASVYEADLPEAAFGHVHLDAFSAAGARAVAAAESEGVVVLIDGAIINRDAVLARFPAAVALESADVTAAVAAYSADPENWLTHLEGPFSISLWDRRRRRLVVARDRMGEKPVYYHATGRAGIVFGSEIKAILAHPAYQRELDREAVSIMFAFGYIPGPSTLFKGINKLLPGESVTLDFESGVSRRRYWRIPRVSDGFDSEQESTAAAKEVFLEGLERYLDGSTRAGVFFSGGIDSSIVLAGLAELGVPDVHTFSIGFRANEHNKWEANDLRFAKRVAEVFGATHHELVVHAGHDIVADLPRVLSQQDDFITTPNAYSKTLLAALVREKGITSMLTGLGSGAPFGFWQPSKLQGMIDALSGSPTDEEKFYRSHGRLFRPDKQERFLATPPVSDEQIIAVLHDYVGELPEGSPPEQYLRRDPFYFAMITQAEKDVRGWEAACSLASIEVRSPFMYLPFLEYAAKLPATFDGVTPVSSKAQVTRAFEPVLPPYVLTRRAIGYPSYYWTHGELEHLQRTVFRREKVEAEGIFNYRGVQRIFESEDINRKAGGKASFTITQFALWHEVHFNANPGLFFPDER